MTFQRSETKAKLPTSGGRDGSSGAWSTVSGAGVQEMSPPAEWKKVWVLLGRNLLSSLFSSLWLLSSTFALIPVAWFWVYEFKASSLIH